MDVTLLELHLPDARFNAPFANRPETEEGDDREDADEAAPADAGGSGGAAIVALLVLAGLAALAWYLRGGRERVEVEGAA